MAFFKISFSLPDESGTFSKVSIAGTFNSWSSSENELSYDPLVKQWATTLTFPTDTYKIDDKIFYKFVINDQDWVCNESNDMEADLATSINNNVIKLSEKYLVEETSTDSNISSSWIDVPRESGASDTSHLQKTVEDANTQLREEYEQLESELQSSEKDSNSTDNSVQCSPLQTSSAKDNSNNNNSQNYYSWLLSLARLLDSIKWFFRYYLVSLFDTKKPKSKSSSTS
ncbi:hypothetical protein CANARDRAFT_22669 [[Candida] arabinofermentans NRRL YB-2248]|uniref:Uncharacterized protein n=1 Tax=[Candida] arabinofermentans NRRL YB-2248 TaxID=983967 RepID=A0A1E4T2D7_9ASCO|nr:hypothetical protein CANARDRAFT_22669 [[Candida] arabinofermentans NRRL YB-2248]